MIYRDFKGLKLSNLALGTMRLPLKGKNDKDIDVEATAEMIDYALKNGVNYFDTAWGYHGGNSEKVVGEILSKYPRDSFYLATKFPGYDLKNMKKVEKIFEEQLKRCRTDYFDFYLFHNVCEMNIKQYLNDEKYGIFSYLCEQKRKGRIRHLGLSVHGKYDTLKKFLDKYGDEMEFCQIQLNYLDYKFQNARYKVRLLNERNIPIWVMEPLRGGKLAVLDDKYKNKLLSMRPDESVPGWAFRYLQSVEGVTTVLSGMSNLEQLKENIRIFSEDKPLNEEETKVLYSIADDMKNPKILPCTACRYCVDHCPQGLDIPELLSLYNEHIFTGGGFLAPMAFMAMDDSRKPSACIGCKSCEKVCPQKIKISRAMKDFTEKLEASSEI